MKKQKNISSLVLFSIVIVVGGLVVVSWFSQTPNAKRKISAFIIGAVYLGDDDVVLQTKHNNCGPCALKMVFDRYNITSTVAEIEEKVRLTEKGSSMFALKEIAELKGLKVEGWQLSYNDFLKKQFPLLLFVHNDHYVIADSVRKDEVFIRDPAVGRLKINKNKLKNIWNGQALTFLK